MIKQILTEQALYCGDITMPKGFKINGDQFRADILESHIKNNDFKLSKNWDKLNTYVRDHVGLEYGFSLVNKETWGNFYNPLEITTPLLNVDPVNLKNAPDFTLLYGVKVKNCMVKIHYEDNRRKGRSWDIELINNMFIMFPSTNMYYINNKQSQGLNFVQTITYEYI